MYTHIVILACLCGALAYALPVSNSGPQENIDLVQIPLNNGKELDVLTLSESGELSERNKRTIGILRQLFPELSKNSDSIDMAALNEQLQETIRVARQAEAAQQLGEQANPADNETGSSDQTESKAPALDELTLDSDEPDASDDDRNKRFLNLGFGGAGGGAGGSGNFLFDIIRRTADRAARAAGTVYRVVAGTESLDLNDTGSQRISTTTTSTTSTFNSPLKLKLEQQQYETGPDTGLSFNKRTSGTLNDGLFSGSAGTQSNDERANVAISGEDAATVGGDGYTEGIPGPVTRLFVLANRGIANLIQDLILRIAQTSERIVNFKARLITSLI